ncbi:MAG: type II and III secretion system protein family protein [Alphaproteobacteria bacterium]|nr:type II and III secretion system protein family protein [Alphaproteobacteria bacterium]
MININKKRRPLMYSISAIALTSAIVFAAPNKSFANASDYIAAEPTVELDEGLLSKINTITENIKKEQSSVIAKTVTETNHPTVLRPVIEDMKKKEVKKNIHKVPTAKPENFESELNVITPPSNRPDFTELNEHYQEVIKSGGALSDEEMNVEKVAPNKENEVQQFSNFTTSTSTATTKPKNFKTKKTAGVPAPSFGETLPVVGETEDLTATTSFDKKTIDEDEKINDDNDKNQYENIPEKTLLRLPLHKSKILEFDIKIRDVMVAAPDVVDVKIQTPNMAYIVAKAIGDTNIIFTDKDGKIISRVELHVQLDTMAVQDLLSNILSGENIKVSAANQNIILSGSVSNNAAATNAVSLSRAFVENPSNVVNMLTVKGEQQVLLKVKVAEIQRNVLKELGFSTNINNNIGSEYLYDWNAGGSPLNAGGSGAAALYSGILRNTAGTFNTTLSALEKNGLLKTLAEPNMVAVSGETASLLAGGEYPIPVSDSNGQITFEFKPYGVGLSFTPVVLSSGKISLKLSTEVSSLSSQTVVTGSTSIPALNVRRANTTVEMPSGGSLMIAGLLQNDVISNLSGVPGFKDVPILGALFRSQQFQRNETELVISITALLVQPHDPNEFALPTDGFAPSSDLDRLLLGRLYQAHTLKSLPPTSAEIEGPVGYIMK